MKKLLIVILIAFSGIPVFSQSYFIVSGKVTSAVTGLPMQGASVFAQNTTLGTATDAEGNFKLYLPEGGYTIAVTYTGYNTESRRVSNSDPDDRNISFRLSEKEKEMAEVAVVATSEVKDGWTKYGKFFTDKFIGQTSNSTACSIKNPETLKFYFSKKRNRLKVISAEPLQIENNDLGYTIRYALDSFTYEYNTEASLYTGSPLFEEMKPADSVQKLRWDIAREKAYNGSMLHFMRSVYSKSLKENGFEIQFLVTMNGHDTSFALKDYYRAINYEKDDSSQVVEIKPNQLRVGVIYSKEKPSELYRTLYPDEPAGFQFSELVFPAGEPIGIEQNGYYFDQNDIIVNAYWSWEKVADMVPYNYGINATPAQQEPEAPRPATTTSSSAEIPGYN
ncbi:MAG: carboxypeptidase-like regulatory domain-containing protein [Ferruginibacter sp.]